MKCKLICSIGITCEKPPPAAPPLIPKTGPIDGSRTTQVALCPRRLRPWLSPIVVTVFPSPKGVGLTEVTRIKNPCLPDDLDFIVSHLILAIVGPCIIKSLLESPSFAAISSIGLGSALRAISKSLSIVLSERTTHLKPSLLTIRRRACEDTRLLGHSWLPCISFIDS